MNKDIILAGHSSTSPYDYKMWYNRFLILKRK